MVYIFVGIAGFFGAILRYSIGLALFDESKLFPFATLMINLLGSFLLAFLTTVVFKRFLIPAPLKTAIGTGFVGSFTTFSTLSVESVKLFQSHHLLLGFVYVLVSLLGGLGMSRLGFRVRKEEETG
ncbi:fluoride efflux transporter FluC [Neobacillus jeddahensis]|uniref:fluoride efflux transporter FluC n=1 Tax=Neobacillus jeddahensis TaxID=1461580 RepID=UPI00058C321F|nr:CrcB family protein [Neobacillus jeddahensis]